MRTRLTHTTRRLARPALALALVCAQVVAAFGCPVVRTRTAGPPGACGGGECGCETACGGAAEGCCCRVAATPPPPPVDACATCGKSNTECCHTDANSAPEPPACPHCADPAGAKSQAAPHPPSPPAAVHKTPPRVVWVAATAARQCRGEGPLSFLAEAPAVPPSAPSTSNAEPAPAGVVVLLDSAHASHVSIPLDPPPRCGSATSPDSIR